MQRHQCTQDWGASAHSGLPEGMERGSITNFEGQAHAPTRMDPRRHARGRVKLKVLGKLPAAEHKSTCHHN